MSSYQQLAGAYDELTWDVGYEKRADFLEKLFRRSRIPVHTVLDLACGTGSMTWLLAGRGYELIAVDGSQEMLAAAREKSAPAEVPPLFLHQSMPRLDLYGTVDAAICCLDSLNYLTNPRDVQRTFQRLHLFISPGACWPSTCGCRSGWPPWTDRCSWTRRRTPTACGAPNIAGGCVPIIWTCSPWRRAGPGTAASSCTASGATPWSS